MVLSEYKTKFCSESQENILQKAKFMPTNSGLGGVSKGKEVRRTVF